MPPRKRKRSVVSAVDILRNDRLFGALKSTLNSLLVLDIIPVVRDYAVQEYVYVACDAGYQRKPQWQRYDPSCDTWSCPDLSVKLARSRDFIVAGNGRLCFEMVNPINCHLWGDYVSVDPRLADQEQSQFNIVMLSEALACPVVRGNNPDSHFIYRAAMQENNISVYAFQLDNCSAAATRGKIKCLENLKHLMSYPRSVLYFTIYGLFMVNKSFEDQKEHSAWLYPFTRRETSTLPALFNTEFISHDLNIRRSGDGQVMVEGRYLYSCGGFDGSNRVPTCERYDVQTKELKVLTPMQMVRYQPCLAYVEGCVFAIGGQSAKQGYIRKTERYSPHTNSWFFVALVPFGCRSAVAGVSIF